MRLMPIRLTSLLTGLRSHLTGRRCCCTCIAETSRALYEEGGVLELVLPKRRPASCFTCRLVGLYLRRVDLYEAWDELRNAEAGKAIALDEGTCIGRVASPVEDSTSTMLACLSEDERHQR